VQLKWLRIVLGAVVLMLLALALAVWLTRATAGPGEIVLPAKTPFTKGPHFAYAQPWGGEAVTLTKAWAPHADALVINLAQFPRNTRIHWRWPPITAGFGPGVWGYNAVMYGDYDGGPPEVPIKPIRVRDLRDLRQAFSWRMSNSLGDGNVLTEFYLRSSTTDVNAKVLELGWFFHMPDSTRKFFDTAAPVGVFTEPSGRRWMVRIADKFCMFGPERPQDITSGTLDMLAALRWLQQKKRITGNEWMSGLALGVEPVIGIGDMTVERWSVSMK
jgi:hypothetical protein